MQCSVVYVLVFQCFRVGYRGICHASLVFSIYTRAFRRVRIRRKYKWQMACFTVYHEKALHNYFIPCLNLQITYGNFRKRSEISGNFRKLGKRFKPVFESLNDLCKFWKIFCMQSSEIFGKVRKRSKTVLKLSENLRKCSEIFGNFRKTSETV